MIQRSNLPLVKPRSSKGLSAAGISGSVQAAMVTAKNAMTQALLGCPKNGIKRAKRCRKDLFTETDGVVEFVTGNGTDFA